MITVQSPLRLPICGGGSDICTHWRKSGGFLVTADIDKYLTVTVTSGNRLNTIPQNRYATAAGWSDMDLVAIESDVPEGSGLGGSSSLMVALLRAKYPDIQPHELAMAAYHLERFFLCEPVGYQDAFAAAFGGCIALDIDTMGRAITFPVRLPPDFHSRLLLMATGIQRSAADVLRKQASEVCTKLVSREAMDQIAQLGHIIYEDLRNNQGKRYGELCDQHWQFKQATTGAVTNSAIDAWYELARKNGASGGKCIGAGGGGFLLFVVEPPDRQHLVETMTTVGLIETPFQFIDHGARVIP